MAAALKSMRKGIRLNPTWACSAHLCWCGSHRLFWTGLVPVPATVKFWWQLHWKACSGTSRYSSLWRKFSVYILFLFREQCYPYVIVSVTGIFKLYTIVWCHFLLFQFLLCPLYCCQSFIYMCSILRDSQAVLGNLWSFMVFLVNGDRWLNVRTQGCRDAESWLSWASVTTFCDEPQFWRLDSARYWTRVHVP